jgi:hypothetical protein
LGRIVCGLIEFVLDAHLVDLLFGLGIARQKRLSLSFLFDILFLLLMNFLYQVLIISLFLQLVEWIVHHLKDRWETGHVLVSLAILLLSHQLSYHLLMGLREFHHLEAFGCALHFQSFLFIERTSLGLIEGFGKYF